MGEIENNIYEIVIYSTYGNVIRLQTDLIDDAVNEILTQPWVVRYEIHQVKKSDYKVLIKNH